MEGSDIQQLVCGGDQTFVIISGDSNDTTGDTEMTGVNSAISVLEHIPIQLNRTILKEFIQQAQETSNYRNLQRIVRFHSTDPKTKQNKTKQNKTKKTIS